MPDSVAGSGSSNRGCSRAQSTFAATAQSSSEGDRSSVLDQGRKLPQPSDKAATPVDRGGIHSYDGVENLTAAQNSGDFNVRLDGRTHRRTDGESEKMGRESPLGGTAEGVGRRGASPPTAVSSGEQVTLPSQQAQCGFRSNGLDQGETFEEHPGSKGTSPPTYFTTTRV